MYQDGFNHPGTSNKKGSNPFPGVLHTGKNWSLLLLITEAFQRFSVSLKNISSARRSPDLKSGVKKCPNLFRLCGFEIRSKGVCFLLLGDYKSPGFNRSNIF